MRSMHTPLRQRLTSYSLERSICLAQPCMTDRMEYLMHPRRSIKRAYLVVTVWSQRMSNLWWGCLCTAAELENRLRGYIDLRRLPSLLPSFCSCWPSLQPEDCTGRMDFQTSSQNLDLATSNDWQHRGKLMPLTSHLRRARQRKTIRQRSSVRPKWQRTLARYAKA